MRKMIALVALTMGIGLLAVTDLPFASAQEKKEVKKPEVKKEVKKEVKPETKKEEAESKLGTIEVYKAKDGFRFRIRDTEGKVLAISSGKGVETSEEAFKELELLKTTLNKVKPALVKD